MTFPSLYGMMQRAYMERYRVSEEIMASIPVKNHHHGSLNHLAHFQNSITTETVLASGMVAEPIRLLHCSPISDGAAAVVLEMSEVVKSGEVEVVGLGVGGDTIGLSGRRSLTSLLATKTATQRAMKMSGLTIDQIEVAELHDCFSVAEAMALEDVGLVPEGRAAAMVADGYGRVGSDGVVINSSGGLKACGHPVGATGVKQVVEIVWQLTGRVGKRQKNNARVGLTHNVGGTGATAVVQIFRRAD